MQKSLIQRPARADKRRVISLKKYLDNHDSEHLAEAMKACRDLLGVMGECGSQACPHLGEDLQAQLVRLQRRLRDEAEPGALGPTVSEAEKALRAWGDRAAGYYKLKASEVRELMLVLAQAAESVGDRDQRYTSEFNSLTERLQAIANLEDLTSLRGALTANVAELKKCVAQMTKDNNDSVKRLNAELAAYRNRLEETERIASVDALTGLANRRRAELALDQFVLRAQPFNVLIFDINDFKQINDRLGHMAGDDLLRQFAVELKLALRSADLAGRWGGDEFIVVLDCGPEQAETQRNRIRDWVVGEYTLRAGADSCRVTISAAIGMAGWARGDDITATLNRADAAMYRDKQESKRGAETKRV
jgi:diguanylate cyclase (GGDEF)-like protein